MKSKRKGFTLGELLIVVAIIAILVVVSVPIFAEQLGKTKEITCMANRRSLFGVLATEYQSGEIDEAKITSLNLTKDNGYLFEGTEYSCPDGGTITAKLENGTIKISCSEHHTAYSFGDVDTMNAIKTCFTSQMDKANISNVDSTANTTNTLAILENLKNAGYENMDGFTCWRFDKNSNNNGTFLFTTVDITKLKPGTSIPVLQYRFDSNNYTVWKGTVKETTLNKKTYNIIGGTSGSAINGDKVDQTYLKALDCYEKLLKEIGV